MVARRMFVSPPNWIVLGVILSNIACGQYGMAAGGAIKQEKD